MKKNLIGILLSTLMFMYGLFGMANPVLAETNDSSDAKELASNDSVSGMLDPDDSNWYIYHMPGEKGAADFTLYTPSDDDTFKMDFYDSSMNSIGSKGYGSSLFSPFLGFSPNSYIYIKITADTDNEWDSEYQLTASFTENKSLFETDDKNGIMSQADKFTDRIIGNINSSDDIDFFKYTASTNGSVDFELKDTDSTTFDETNANWSLNIYNANGKQLGDIYYNNTDTGIKTASISVKKSESLYIMIKGQDDESISCEYTLSSSFSKKSSSFPIKKALTLSIPGTAGFYQYIDVKKGGSYEITAYSTQALYSGDIVSIKGTFKNVKKAQKYKYTMKAVEKTKDGKSASTKVILYKPGYTIKKLPKAVRNTPYAGLGKGKLKKHVLYFTGKNSCIYVE